jgi:hypothetical protein
MKKYKNNETNNKKRKIFNNQNKYSGAFNHRHEVKNRLPLDSPLPPNKDNNQLMLVPKEPLFC